MNVERLTALLNDPATNIFTEVKGEPAIRFYFVRDAAFRTLKEWGIDVVRPVIREYVIHQ